MERKQKRRRLNAGCRMISLGGSNRFFGVSFARPWLYASIMTTPVSKGSQAPATPEELASRARKSPALLKGLMENLGSDEAGTRFGSAKALRLIAENHPELLYPMFGDFVRLLGHPNKIFQWEGAIVLSHLARVDAEDKFTPAFEKYFEPISGQVMITAANVIGGAPRIARAKPELAGRIASELLKVKSAGYATPECRNVVIGHAINAFAEFFDLLQDPEPVLEFVRGQLENSRPATRKKAARLLKNLGVSRRA